MKVSIWRGLHHSSLISLLETSWEKNQLLILVPISLRDFSFLKMFTQTSVSLMGDWPADLQSQLHFSSEENDETLPQKAVLGLFTSGTSSGLPRLVLYSKENITTSLQAIRELFDQSRLHKIFVYPQPTHTFGLILGYLHALLFQKKLVFGEGSYSRQAHDLWLNEVDEGTLTLGTPTHFMDLIHHVRKLGVKPKPSYSAILGGARVTQKLWLELQEVLQIEAPSVGYGATEASPGVTHLPPGVPPNEDGDIGFLLKGVQLENSNENGILIDGKNICLGLVDQSGLQTPHQIRLNDFLVQNPPDGRFTFVGRTDLLINRGGLKISLEVVESLISSFFATRCLAFAFYDERLGEDIGMLVSVTAENASPRVNEIRSLLSEKMGVKLSENNFCFGEIPVNSNGKFDRKEALQIFLKKKTWNFPLSIAHVHPFLPHRGSAIWVDTILGAHKNYGLVEVVLRQNAPYFSGDRIRPSAAVEWVAQAFGYTYAMNGILGHQKTAQANKTFIAEIKTCDFLQDSSAWKLQPASKVQIEVKCSHDFGVLKIVQGRVFQGEKDLAQMNLRLYSGQ